MEKAKNKSFLLLYMLGTLIVLGSVYTAIQYAIFSKKYEQNFLNTTHVLEKRLSNTLKKYKVTLLEFAKEIKKKDLFSDSEKLSELFEKNYTYGIEGQDGQQIHLSAVNWVGKGDAPTVGRFGLLLHKLEFSPEYLEKLKRNPGNFEVWVTAPEDPQFEPSITNFGIGVDDEKEVYRGFVNARIDTKTLLESLNVDGVQVILIDKNNLAIASSMNFTADERRKLQEILKNQDMVHFSRAGYIFTAVKPISDYPYSLLLGYSEKGFYVGFFDYLYPQLLSVIVISLSLILLAYFYHLYILKQGWRVLRKRIGELHSTIDKLGVKCSQLMDKNKDLEEDRKRHESSLREERKFLMEVNKRSSEAVSALLNTGNALLERIKYQEELDDNPQEVMDIFENAYLHGRFICRKSREEPVDINNVLDESITMHYYKITENKISILKNFDKDIKTIFTDAHSLRQVLINILGRVIENIPTEGKIEINVSGKKATLHIEFKDNGYEAENLKRTKSSLGDEKSSLDSMFLEWHDLQKLVRSLGGLLSYSHKPYQGNHFVFQLPYQFHKASSPKEEMILPKGDNIILFSAVKKNEKS